MKEITYKIKFHSEWHCGSGLTSGSDLDALVVKDAEGFPFIPGKTIKGLLKEAAEELLKIQEKAPINEPFITEMFGYFDNKDDEKSEIHTKGTAFFSNAVLSSNLRNEIKETGLIDFLYRDVASTAIEKNGIAKAHSLRKMQTVIPCELIGTISRVDETYEGDLKKCLNYIKRLGQNRNRGLGRCTFIVVEPNKEAKE